MLDHTKGVVFKDSPFKYFPCQKRVIKKFIIFLLGIKPENIIFLSVFLGIYGDFFLNLFDFELIAGNQTNNFLKKLKIKFV